MQNGKGRASSLCHLISVIPRPVIWGGDPGGESGGELGGDPISDSKSMSVPVVTSINITACRLPGSASSAIPVSGPIFSQKIRTSPALRWGKLPLSVAWVAPFGKQQFLSPQV